MHIDPDSWGVHFYYYYVFIQVGRNFVLFLLPRLAVNIVIREAFNKKKHFFYGIFHNGQTPPPVMEKKHFFDA